jgi:Chitin binding Peritrophin-A domain
MASTLLISVLVGLGLLSLVSGLKIDRKPVLDPRCPVVEDEDSDVVLFPHESDCEKYMVCSNGYAFEMQCQTGLVFNPIDLVSREIRWQIPNTKFLFTIQVCDWPYNVECPIRLDDS